MSGRIPQSFVQTLLDRVDIVDVVGSRVKLRKSGKNHSGLCPFHNENTPSFTVNQSKQFYYCFGCGAAGDALKFVMEQDGLDFVQAIEHLASLAGLTVPREEVDEKTRQRDEEKRSLYALLEEATQYFQQQLKTSPERGKAIHYLKNRGVSQAIAKRYQIGYAPPGWNNLMDELATDEHRKQQLRSLGLLNYNEEKDRWYDFFRDRIMFPIRDRRGRPIAYGGRILTSEKTAKYLNSPETPVFNKGQELYGLYEARRHVSNLEQLIVVEGYMDVIALAQFGIENAVATLGTATSASHIQTMKRYVKEIIFCFDGDEAGKKAAWRGLEAALPIIEDGDQIKFLFLPAGEDPDSLVRKVGVEGFQAELKGAKGLSDTLFEQVSAHHDLQNIEGRAAFAQALLGHIQQVKAPLVKSLLKQKLIKITGLDDETLAAMPAPEPVPHAPSEPEYQPAPQYAPRPEHRPEAPATSVPSAMTRLMTVLVRYPVLTKKNLPTWFSNFHDESAVKVMKVKQALEPVADQPYLLGIDALKQAGLADLVAQLQISVYFEMLNSSDKSPELWYQENLDMLAEKLPDEIADGLRRKFLAGQKLNKDELEIVHKHRKAFAKAKN
ncbi:DNA primase [Salinibius halmophilus]|uniref:DNA primase n=1 Tax=Salinibius halmophilus TaxID=1853216 RepID=UPI000E672F76|nr:DNA primase [Salinibius halmophilus]